LLSAHVISITARGSVNPSVIAGYIPWGYKWNKRGSWNENDRELLHLGVYHNGSYGVKYRKGERRICDKEDGEKSHGATV
jgi:hypothetical protein